MIFKMVIKKYTKMILQLKIFFQTFASWLDKIFWINNDGYKYHLIKIVTSKLCWEKLWGYIVEPNNNPFVILFCYNKEEKRIFQ